MKPLASRYRDSYLTTAILTDIESSEMSQKRSISTMQLLFLLAALLLTFGHSYRLGPAVVEQELNPAKRKTMRDQGKKKYLVRLRTGCDVAEQFDDLEFSHRTVATDFELCPDDKLCYRAYLNDDDLERVKENTCTKHWAESLIHGCVAYWDGTPLYSKTSTRGTSVDRKTCEDTSDVYDEFEGFWFNLKKLNRETPISCRKSYMKHNDRDLDA